MKNHPRVFENDSVGYYLRIVDYNIIYFEIRLIIIKFTIETRRWSIKREVPVYTAHCCFVCGSRDNLLSCTLQNKIRVGTYKINLYNTG